ncbi:MAG: lytic transglycosylase domain-containing protein, partial [bacterium]|nr:lytic transglycosylase domain-containing protein [bacterium]
MDAMEESLAKQRESIRNQVGGAQAAPDSFFTFGWPAFPSIASPPEVAEVGAPPEASLPPEPPHGETQIAGWDNCGPIPPSLLQGYIERVAEREGLTPDLLRAVIDRESAFDPCAVSVKGAQGLMQLMPATAAELGVSDPLDPQQNIDGGARYLGQLLTRYGGDISLALGAYNAGPARVDQYHGLPPISETLNYVSHIMDR